MCHAAGTGGGRIAHPRLMPGKCRYRSNRYGPDLNHSTVAGVSGGRTLLPVWRIVARELCSHVAGNVHAPGPQIADEPRGERVRGGGRYCPELPDPAGGERPDCPRKAGADCQADQLDVGHPRPLPEGRRRELKQNWNICMQVECCRAQGQAGNIRRSVIELSGCADHDAWSAMLVAGSPRTRLAQVPCPGARRLPGADLGVLRWCLGSCVHRV